MTEQTQFGYSFYFISLYIILLKEKEKTTGLSEPLHFSFLLVKTNGKPSLPLSFLLSSLWSLKYTHTAELLGHKSAFCCEFDNPRVIINLTFKENYTLGCYNTTWPV